MKGTYEMDDAKLDELERGCGDAEVCRIMQMTDDEIIAATPDAEGGS